VEWYTGIRECTNRWRNLQTTCKSTRSIREKAVAWIRRNFKNEINMKLLQHDPQFEVDNFEFTIRDWNGIIVQIGQTLLTELHCNSKTSPANRRDFPKLTKRLVRD
jgi:hypothetical protein